MSRTLSAPAVRVARLGRFVPLLLAVYVGCRLVTAVVLSIVAERQVPTGWNGDPVPAHVTYWSFTAQWDGQWYQQIAEQGYPKALPVDQLGVVQQNAWAFYPLFPLLARVAMELSGASFAVAGAVVATLLGVVAAVVLGVLLRERLGARAALLTVAVWACGPATATLQVAYTESAAMALLALVLLALSRERWWWAAGLAVLLGLTRPIAVPLGVVVLVALWLRWRRRERDPVTRQEAAGALAALVGCAVAGFLWPAIAWWATGRQDAYTQTMGAWRSGHEITPLRPWLDMARYVAGDTWGPVLLTSLVVLVLVMTLGPWARRLGPQLRAWSLAYPGYLLLVLDPFTSVFRYLVPLFPLCAVLVGVGGERRHWGWVWARTALLLVVGVVGQWYWVDVLWRFVPPTDYPP